MPAVRVRIVGEGRTVELQTNAQGVFERYGLPPGEYRVEPVLSDGLRVYSQRILGVPDS